MRFCWWAFALPVLVAAPALAQQSASPAAADRITVTFHLRFQDSALVTQALTDPSDLALAADPRLSRLPAGLSFVGYVLDNSLIVRGSSADLREFASAVVTIDVPLEATE